MRTFSTTTPTSGRGRRTRLSTLALRLYAPVGSRLDPRAENGFLLIEVLVSSLMVALIATATFSGFDIAGRTAADGRARDQAGLLASQAQEQLRSEPASALDELQSTPHSFTAKAGGTTYTIVQEAKPVGSSGNTTGCSVSEKTAQSGANFQITSTVTWPRQVKAGRPAVTQSSVVTPPTGSAIEVDVVNGASSGVSGVTAKATFIPVESGSYNTVEGTTGATGCVVLGGIQATTATVEIVPRVGFVTPSGTLKVPLKELTITPSLTTHYEVQYAEAGRIAAKFTYKNETSWLGKEVKSDTFVAGNTSIPVEPKYEVGSTAFGACEGAEELYKPVAGTYFKISETAACTQYPRGDLFPFSSPWYVYAGDCTANKAPKEAEASVVVTSGSPSSSVNVPLSYTKLSVWTGNSSTSKGELTKTKGIGPVSITGECESAPLPNNTWGSTYLHKQTEILAGELENPFQPFGTFELCVVDSLLAKPKTFTTSPFTNSNVAGSTPQIYLGQKTAAEQSAVRAAQTATETTLNNEEAAAATAKTTRENTESSERATWQSEKNSGKITESQRTAKVTAQTTARGTTETAETTAKNKRTTEKTALATLKNNTATEQAAENASKVTVEEGNKC
jgi:type II secretory pathway pseudopilin PulG